MVDKLLALVLILALVGLGGSGYFVATSRGSSEEFTEFYILGPGGKAEAYPSLVKVGENATVILGVVNNEGQDTAYRVVVRIDGENSERIANLALGDNERWEKRVVLAPTRAGDGQKVEFLLFNERERGTYRSLHLSLDVEGAPPEATPEPEGFVSPRPAASPTATPLPIAAPLVVGPAGLVYPVQPGDTLTALSERFGLSLEALAAANGMAEPGPILTGQELVIPGTVYTVQPGDTLADIAAAFGVAPAPILASNAIADPSAIYSGQELFIPVPAS